ncbi:MAG: flagellar basal body rod protein FlgB [Candidatus Nitricoxidivorans perseverans]|uniref:Flagellar basal body rod protein FlgB n=1 Tax=Candidatus Nitricoxidivorans perseverans TaxID=2975601 RepID=A0AA49FND5_9PROT|nr:MAG: flagellar basal body rod protein FlgB [Candidatus Nitricoxidivorans perseverans]
MIDRLDQELRFNQMALGVRAQRQELLASNIANADTPHYKARDIDFRSALEGALSGRADGALAVRRTSPGHLEGEGGGRFGAAVLYRSEFQAAVDGNTVNMDVERSAFAENAIQIEAALTFVREKFRHMQAAIQGQ